MRNLKSDLTMRNSPLHSWIKSLLIRNFSFLEMKIKYIKSQINSLVFFNAWRLLHLLANWLLTRRVGGTSSPWQVGWCWWPLGARQECPSASCLETFQPETFLGARNKREGKFVPNGEEELGNHPCTQVADRKGVRNPKSQILSRKEKSEYFWQITCHIPHQKPNFVKTSFRHLIQYSEEGKHS